MEKTLSDTLKYALDSSIFIEAKNRYYSFDLCPGFWDALLWHHNRNLLSSIDRIKAELDRGDDDLTKWINKTMPKTCFVSTDDPEVIRWFGQIVTWVQAQSQFIQAAKADFAKVADGWLIAYAKANNLVLVTHEVYNQFAKGKVKIPNVCKAFNVTCVDTFDMLKDLKTSFIWKSPS
ncbi:hypothetical protein MBAV_005346 [Candidatus Magnetobacterium bavaricum]|uniref:Uncharacterized protein n=1 Tax=Candidatus Magnetobacterium bavaricum TaxID=29290 RepID=A0A0F3GKP5_9BACT|nr:hypothetical protein MBAV_005346 [Candidatus Magnetobacterium bavaricum]